MAIIECPECHKEISDQAAQCPQCGCPIKKETAPPPPPEPKLECPECRKEVSDQAVQCPHCGFPLCQEGVPSPFSKLKDVFSSSRPVKLKSRSVYLAIAAVVLILGGVFLYHKVGNTFTNYLGMEFVLIPAGSFMMGVDPALEKSEDDETPQHQVTISRPFYLGVYEVTQEQWEAVMGDNPSEFEGRNNPVEQVSWDDVQAFIRRLNQKEGNGEYRLPTEAEWEYAARAGTDTVYFFGNGAEELGQYAWYGDHSGDKTQPVGGKEPNPWGLYDIYGNVFEWVADWYGGTYYAGNSATDPQGPSRGSSRVLRGGSWRDTAWWCRSASRSDRTPDIRFNSFGFRLAFSPGQ